MRRLRSVAVGCMSAFVTKLRDHSLPRWCLETKPVHVMITYIVQVYK